MPLAPGSKLGQYEIIAPLGAGGMGEVYRARDPQLGRDVAIKLLPSSFSRDPDRLRRFEQEARAAAALNHPNILAVFQMGSHDGAPYLVSELLEGSTLRDQLLRGPVPVRKAADYAMQAARGLAAAHEKGIVHRDLKPENLFLTRDGRIKILDFGLAKLLPQRQASDPGAATMTEATEPGVVLGTVGYMSPEQVRGISTDHRTDLFSLGAILYEMLTGKRAFHKSTSAETMTAILNEEPESASQITPATPPALQKIVQRCLEKSSEQRFHSASDLAFALEALSDSGSAPTGAFAPPASRGSRSWIVAAALLAVAASVLGVWLTHSTSAPVVEAVAQLTNDGQAKSSVVTDRSRIYFNEGTVGSLRMTQVSVNGGQTGPVPTSLVNPQIAGIASDGSSLLVVVGGPVPTQTSVWTVPLPAGDARRVGGGEMFGVNFFPDGRLVYTTKNGIFVADKDGSNPRMVSELSKFGDAPTVSPDGTKFVLLLTDNKSQNWAIDVAGSDGTGFHPILKSGPGLPDRVCCVQWTGDGKYILFGSNNNGRTDIWALPDERRFLRSGPTPARLTNGPLSYDFFTSSRDGRQILAIGFQRRGELVRFDSKVRDFVSFLGGISAYDITFSRDGKWAAYLSYPEHTLWRSRADGSDRLQLTYPPLIVDYPRISPDGTRVAFSTEDGNALLVGMDGGSPTRMLVNDLGHATAPDWSPDGKLLALTCEVPGTESASGYLESRVLDLRTGKATSVADSKGTIGPWFFTQDTLVATSIDQSTFVLLDLKTGKRSDLVTSADKFSQWEMSPDGMYFYYQTAGNDPKVFRMRVRDHAVEEETSLKTFRSVADPYMGGSQLNVTPDNSLLLTRDIGTQEVYAISVKWP